MKKLSSACRLNQLVMKPMLVHKKAKKISTGAARTTDLSVQKKGAYPRCACALVCKNLVWVYVTVLKCRTIKTRKSHTTTYKTKIMRKKARNVGLEPGTSVHRVEYSTAEPNNGDSKTIPGGEW